LSLAYGWQFLVCMNYHIELSTPTRVFSTFVGAFTRNIDLRFLKIRSKMQLQNYGMGYTKSSPRMKQTQRKQRNKRLQKRAQRIRQRRVAVLYRVQKQRKAQEGRVQILKTAQQLEALLDEEGDVPARTLWLL